jgi:hypothetical protein
LGGGVRDVAGAASKAIVDKEKAILWTRDNLVMVNPPSLD